MGTSAGFVLTGGRSSRMGRDKALLPIEGSVLMERTTELLSKLLAVYRRQAGEAVEFAIKHKCFKMHDLLKALQENVNTPLEWGAR